MTIRRWFARWRRPAQGQAVFWFLLSKEPLYFDAPAAPRARRRPAPSRGRNVPPWRRGRRADRPSPSEENVARTVDRFVRRGGLRGHGGRAASRRRA